MEIKRTYNLKIARKPETELKFKELKTLKILPPFIDLRSKLPPIYNQGSLGSCTANALCAAYDFKDGIANTFIPSRLFLYYNERLVEKTVNKDAGAYLSTGIKSLQTYGVCSEKLWPYKIEKFKIKPTVECYNDSKKHKAVIVTNIKQDLISMKTCLANTIPFVVGFLVYESFDTPQTKKTGVIPFPDTKKEEMLGGHAILVCGYNEKDKRWLCRNSWGSSWGMKGYFTLPYKYLLNKDLSSDLWNITKVTNPVLLKISLETIKEEVKEKEEEKEVKEKEVKEKVKEEKEEEVKEKEVKEKEI